MDIMAVFTLVQRMSGIETNVLLALILIGTLSLIAKQRRASRKVVDVLEADLCINCIGILVPERGVDTGS